MKMHISNYKLLYTDMQLQFNNNIYERCIALNILYNLTLVLFSGTEKSQSGATNKYPLLAIDRLACKTRENKSHYNVCIFADNYDLLKLIYFL